MRFTDPVTPHGAVHVEYSEYVSEYVSQAWVLHVASVAGPPGAAALAAMPAAATASLSPAYGPCDCTHRAMATVADVATWLHDAVRVFTPPPHVALHALYGDTTYAYVLHGARTHTEDVGGMVVGSHTLASTSAPVVADTQVTLRVTVPSPHAAVHTPDGNAGADQTLAAAIVTTSAGGVSTVGVDAGATLVYTADTATVMDTAVPTATSASAAVDRVRGRVALGDACAATSASLVVSVAMDTAEARVMTRAPTVALIDSVVVIGGTPVTASDSVHDVPVKHTAPVTAVEVDVVARGATTAGTHTVTDALLDSPCVFVTASANTCAPGVRPVTAVVDDVALATCTLAGHSVAHDHAKVSVEAWGSVDAAPDSVVDAVMEDEYGVVDAPASGATTS